ncbi:MAG TPA: hypothetical protein VK191_00080 [Symbiobacteriaceae bacterium]|nr:hypothetical protein [Symbiobacteriaceae bacterium]
MSDIIHLLRQLVQAELARQFTTQLAIVEEVPAHADGDDQPYACSVRLPGETDLILPSVPILTGPLGLAVPPAKGDKVLLQYIGTDPAQPVIVGRLYPDELKPPPYDQGEVRLFLPPGAAESDRLDLHLTGGKSGSRLLELKLPSDLTLTVTDKKIEATVGTLQLQMDAEAGKVTIKTDGATVTVENSGALTLESSGNLKIAANGNLEIQAGGNLKLNANGMAELKGSVVNLN